MKKTTLALAISLMASGSVFANTFVNGGFEDGNLGGWTGGGGSWYGSPNPPVPPSTYTGGTSNNYVMTAPGVDPYTGASTVYGGKYSVRLNDNNNNYSVSTISQTVNNYTDNSIYFAWNAVLQSSHGLTNSDYFSLTLHDNTVGDDLVSRAYSSAGSIGAGTTGVTWVGYPGGPWGSTIYSAGWVVEQVDLAALGRVGNDFTLTMLASDCPYGGHFGYVYLDGFGATTPPTGGVPEPATMALLGLGLLGMGAARRRKNG